MRTATRVRPVLSPAGDQQDGGGVDTDAVDREQLRGGGSHECVELAVEQGDLRVDRLHSAAEGHDRGLGCVPDRVSLPRGRNPAASVINALVVTPLSRTRRSSGAVMTRCRSWPVVLIRIERAERFATNNARSASTLPVPLFACASSTA